MNRFLILIVLVIFLNPISAQQNKSVALNLVTSNTELEPGKIHTVVYKIKNDSTATIKLAPGITLPKDWKVISEIKNITLNPGEQEVLIISINIPAKYSAGAYYFILSMVDPANVNNVYAEVRSEWKVKEETSFSVELGNSPDFVKAGELAKASYIVRNTGNTSQTVVLNTFNCIIDGPQKIFLAPGSSTEVKTASETDATLKDQTKKYFYLEANCNGVSSGQVFGFVNVIPFNNETDDLYHRFPVLLTTRYVAKGRDGNFRGGIQYEASGSVTIDPQGKHTIEFLARGPNRFDMSLLGLYDEYYFSYSNNFFSMKAGDASYNVTPLTEYARFGTGFEQKIKVAKFSQLGMLYVTPRFYKNIKAEYGAYAKFDVYKQNNVGFYFLRKLMPGQEKDVNLFSMTANLQPFERTSLEMEASKSTAANASDNAYRVSLNSQISDLSLAAFFFHAGKNYQGYYTNSDFYSGNLTYSPVKWLSVGLNARKDFINAKLDTLFMTAPLSKQYQGMLNFRIGKRMFMRVYARQYERQDRSLLERFHFKTQSFNFAFINQQNRIGYNLEGELGKTRNFLLNDAGDSNKNTFSGYGNLYFQPTHNLYMQAFLNYSNVNSFISGQQNDWIFGLNLSASFLKNFRTGLQLQNTYSIEDSYQNRNLFQFNLEYHFLKRHTISLNSFYTLFQNEMDNPDFSFALNYSISFGIPMKKVSSAGSVSGKIANLGVDKVGGILLIIGGRSAVTNENGEFSFKNIKPGTYNLLIDRTTLNMSDICNVSTPIEVIVEDNKESIVDFGLTKAAKVSGNIELGKIQDNADGMDDETQVVSHIVLELARDGESMRIITDEKGRFSFPYVRPGKWFLKIYTGGIDKQYILEKDYFDLDLQPGEQKNVSVKIQKKKRNIIFLNNNINLSSGKK
jgi:hypothetical protein